MTEKITLTLDPNSKFKNVTEESILQMLGLLPGMIQKAMNNKDKKMWDSLEEQYISSLYEFKGSSINPETLVYSYPGDPSLQPLCLFEKDGRRITFYDCAIVGVCEGPGEKFRITRMD